MVVEKPNTYGHIHKWLRNTYGKAYHCENPECNHLSKTYDWALIKDCEYKYKRENFHQLCRKCHNHYDGRDGWYANTFKKGMTPYNKGLKTPQKKKLCPYCNRNIGLSAYSRWHGNKCKKNRLG